MLSLVCICFELRLRNELYCVGWGVKLYSFTLSLICFERNLWWNILDYGNATLVGISMYHLKWLESVLNAAARLVLASPRRDHVSPLLRQLHWLKAPEQIQYKLAVLVYKCLNWMAASYLADEFLQPTDLTSRTRLRSASSLFIRCTRLSTVGDRAFPVAAARIWNSLPRHVTSASSLSVYCSRLKSHLFKQSFPWLLLL